MLVSKYIFEVLFYICKCVFVRICNYCSGSEEEIVFSKGDIFILRYNTVKDLIVEGNLSLI